MGVDAVYLLDEKKQIRRVIVWGVYELIHDEATYELDAEIESEYDARPGEFLAFFDVDERIRMFEIDTAEKDEQRGVTTVTATDAAVAELAHLIVEDVRMTDATARQTTQSALEGSGWRIGQMNAEGTSHISAYYDTRWKVLRDIAAQYKARVTPYFAIENGEITGRYVDVTKRENIFRGRLFEGASGSTQIYVTKSGAPITRMYGIGRATGTEDPPTCVTFADVEAPDKPKGQTYIEDGDAIALYGEGREAVFNDKYIDDPEKLLQATREELQKRKRPKVSGTATAADMEHIPGHEHKIVRMYDSVWVRTKTGEDLQAVVINVKRNYLRRSLTKIIIGEEAEESATGLIAKVAKLSNTSASHGRSSAAASNRYIETKQMIQLNADTIQMNARLIEANAEEIKLKASVKEVTDIGTRLTQAEIDIDGANASILLKADATIVDKMGERVSAAEIEIDGLNSEITLKADKVTINAELTTIKRYFAGSATAAKMVVTNLDAIDLEISSGFSYQNASVDWLTAYAVSSSTIPNYAYVNLTRGDGTTGFYYVFTEQPKVQTKQIKYLGNN